MDVQIILSIDYKCLIIEHMYFFLSKITPIYKNQYQNSHGFHHNHKEIRAYVTIVSLDDEAHYTCGSVFLSYLNI